MSKKKALAIVSISFAFLPMALVGSTFASWAVTDNANPFGFKINIEGQTLEEGHYLYWDGATEGVKLERDDVGGGLYSYTIDIDNTESTMTGSSKTFEIRDESDNLIVNETGGLTIDFEGTYTLTDTGDSYTLTYPLYFDNSNTSFSNCGVHLFNGVNNQGTEWPGYTMSRVGSTSYYKADVDAKKFAKNGTTIIFNNNLNDGATQTENIELNNIHAGTQGYKVSKGTRVYLEYSNVSWWSSDSVVVCAYFFGGGKQDKYFEMSPVAGQATQYGYTTDEDMSGYTNVIFTRCPSGTASSGNGFPPNPYNQTVDLSFTNKKICDYALTGGKDGENKYYSSYTASTNLITTGFTYSA